MGRLLALSDRVFAFAMPLRDLGLLPAVGLTPHVLLAGLQSPNFVSSVVAFVLGFWVTGLYWIGHNEIFSLIGRYDRSLMELNLLVLIFVVLVPFSTIVRGDAFATAQGVVGCAALQSGTGFSLAALWSYASRNGRLAQYGLPQSWINRTNYRTLATPVVFVLSSPVAAIYPLAGILVWVLILVQAVRAPRMAKVLAASDPTVPPRAETPHQEHGSWKLVTCRALANGAAPSIPTHLSPISRAGQSALHPRQDSLGRFPDQLSLLRAEWPRLVLDPVLHR